ncbi:hypothetical protein [Zestomonas carbonaria]|uniref:hypothetical protein n=1 Tax=Zestomonas carbonaria TaxID=2762745 RepID=UPI001F345253|nr:hypothetical protein [Pseudomonas carbonaria]
MIVRQAPNSSTPATWQVCLDQHSVRFRSEVEARQFVATLEARLRAPHTLPELVQRSA